MHLLITFLSPNPLLMQIISMALHKHSQKMQADVVLGFQEGKEVSELNLGCCDVAGNRCTHSVSFCARSASAKTDLKAKQRN